MGGEGSGRRPGTESIVKNLLGFEQPASTDNAVIYLPNYSGVKEEAKKTSPETLLKSGDSHTLLTDIGTNTHAQIDTHITGTGASVHGDSFLLNTGDTATGDYTFDTDTLIIDATNHRIGFNTTSPQSDIHWKQSSNTAWTGAFKLEDAGASTDTWNIVQNPTNSLLFAYGTTPSATPTIVATLEKTGNFTIEGTEASGTGINILCRNKSTGTASFSIFQMRAGTGNDGGIFFGSKAALENYGIANGISFRAGLVTQDIGFSVGASVSGAGTIGMILKSSGKFGVGGLLTPDNSLSVSGALSFTNVAAPTLTSTSGGIFVSGGECWYIGSSGTQTRLAVA